MAKSQKQQAPPNEGATQHEETVTVSKDKLYRLAYRIVVAGGIRLSPNEARKIAVETLGVPWEDIKQYITEHPR